MKIKQHFIQYSDNYARYTLYFYCNVKLRKLQLQNYDLFGRQKLQPNSNKSVLLTNNICMHFIKQFYYLTFCKKLNKYVEIKNKYPENAKDISLFYRDKFRSYIIYVFQNVNNIQAPNLCTYD